MFITDPPITAPTVTVTPLSSTSFTISWTITNPDHNYIIAWTNLRTDVVDKMTVVENTSSYTVTGLIGINNYNVTVTVNNSCGMMMSDPITVYSKIICMYILILATYVNYTSMGLLYS